ncbi:MAG: vWA domain-containing protein [Bdellovibrionota bacterium]
MVITAGMIVGLLIFCGFAVDGCRLFLASLWAQRSADAAAFMGGGTVALRETAALAYNGDVATADALCHTVATQAILNLEVRGAIPHQSANLPMGGCNFNLTDRNLSVEVKPSISSATTEVEVILSFDSPLLILQYLPGFGTLRRVHARATSTVDPVILSILVDTSQSMSLATSGSSSTPKLTELKSSLNAILDLFDPSRDSLSLISFGTRAKVEVPFGTVRGFTPSAFTAAIGSLTAGGDTNYTDALTESAKQVLTLQQNLPTADFDAARVGYLVFGDGAPTAATVALTGAPGAPQPLPASNVAPMGGESLTLPGATPCPVGDRYYTIWGGVNPISGEFLPYRLVAATSNQTLFPKGTSDDSTLSSSLLPACSKTGHLPATTFGLCVNHLGFNYGCGRTFPAVAISNYEELTQLSALAWADYLRTAPKASVVYVVGLGYPAVDATDPLLACSRTDGTPYDNRPCPAVPPSLPAGKMCGGLCSDLRKDSFLSRLAGRSEGTIVPYPNLQTAASIPPEQRGQLFRAKDQNELVDRFVAAAESLKKLRMIN